jgi:hypothetical protein
MEPVSLVLSALEAGNAPDVGIEAMSPDDIRNIYDEFLDLVQAKLQGVGATTLLEHYMAQPDLYESALADTLVEAGVNEDAELIASAQTMMNMMDSRGFARGRYTAEIDEDVEGYV